MNIMLLWQSPWSSSLYFRHSQEIVRNGAAAHSSEQANC